LISLAQQRVERMRVGIERRESVDAKQGRKKQRLKAASQCLLSMMHQGAVVVWMRSRMRRYRLLELDHNRAKEIVLVEPLGKKMHPHTRETGGDVDDLCTRGRRRVACGSAWAALTTIEMPCGPPPIEMADAHRHRSLPLGDLVEQHPARALRVLMEQGPQQGLLHLAKLAPSTKGWTCILIEDTLTRGEGHGFILLTIQFRMQSAPSPSGVNGYFYPQ
jgi:hypothetical protein